MASALPFQNTCCMACDGTTTTTTTTTLGVHTGTGSPEGVVTADPGELYWDTTGHSLWVKQSGSATNTGWEQLIA